MEVGEDGKIYACKFGSTESYEKGVLYLSIYVSNEDMASSEYLGKIALSDTEDIYVSELKRARKSIAGILAETRFFGKLKIDMEEVGSDTVGLLNDITKSLHDKEVYKGAFDALTELPQAGKEVFDLVVSTLSNAEVLSKVVKKGYETVKQDPKEAGLFILSTLTSYDIYKLGLTSENQIYGAGLIFVGLVLDGGTKVFKTAKNAKEAAEAIKEVAKEANNARKMGKDARVLCATEQGTKVATSEKATEKLIEDVGIGEKVSEPASLFSEKAVSKYPEASKYQYNALTNPCPLADLKNTPIKNFYGGYYNQKTATEDMFLYRAGNINKQEGEWFVLTPSESVAKVRIDLAVKEQWINPDTGNFKDFSHIDTVYKYRIPKGTEYYEGPVGTQGRVYLGGLESNQIFIPESSQTKLELISAEPINPIKEEL